MAMASILRCASCLLPRSPGACRYATELVVVVVIIIVVVVVVVAVGVVVVVVVVVVAVGVVEVVVVVVVVLVVVVVVVVVVAVAVEAVEVVERGLTLLTGSERDDPFTNPSPQLIYSNSGIVVVVVVVVPYLIYNLKSDHLTCLNATTLINPVRQNKG